MKKIKMFFSNACLDNNSKNYLNTIKIKIIEPLEVNAAMKKQSPIVLVSSYLIRIAWVSGL